jgi:SAM-dependent methyltransferase
MNVWLYRIGRRNVRAFLAKYGLEHLDGRALLDVGSGTGFWIEVWREMGASRVDGVDLVPGAVERLRDRYPDSMFRAGDISDPEVIPVDATYDFVSVMNVMLHILDEERLASAAANIAGAVGPGGHLFLAEPALTEMTSPPEAKPGASSKARPLSRYREMFESAGLVFISFGASTVVGANPIESGDPNYRRYAWIWKRATRSARRWPRSGGIIGRALDVLDRALMPSGAAPSGKLLLFRRPPE